MINLKEVSQKQEETFEINEKEISKNLDSIRQKLIEKYNEQVLIYIGTKEAETHIKPMIQQIVSEHHSAMQINEAVIGRLYQDIFGFSILDKYLNRDDLEEINGNAWNDIEIITTSGNEKIKESFSSPEHAVNILRKMVLLGNVTIDESSPLQDSYIGTGLRLTTMICPIVDKEVGVAFSLRVLKDREISKEDLIYKHQSYSEEEIELLEMFGEYGVSVIYGGATSSGKSSDIQTIYSGIAKRGEKRIYSIEERARELNMIHYDGDQIKSRVIHTKTRPSKLQNTQNVDSDNLVKAALRYNPDIIIMAETRGSEALASVEAALTGHTLVTSAHIKSVTAAYKRKLRLCKKADPGSSEDMLMDDITNAYPIVVLKKQLTEDNSRRCLRIFEATGYCKESKKVKGRILRSFVKTGVQNGRVIGEHRIVNPISLKLCQILYENGCPAEKIKKFNHSFKEGDIQDYIEEYIEEI